MNATLRGLLAGGLLALCLTTAAIAQTDVEETAERWDSVAVKAEQSVEEVDTPTTELESMRARVVGYRSEFEAARTLNADRIAALRDQLAALGPVPEGENAEPEAPEVAKTRADINQQLNTLLAPVQIAEREFLRADGLVREIDKRIRDRQTERLLRATPSPLNPAYWAPALVDVQNAFAAFWEESAEQDTDSALDTLERNLPTVLLAGLAGLLLLFRGRLWAMGIVNALRDRQARGLGIWRFIVSLLRILFPLAGLFLLSIAARQSGFLGARSSLLVELLPIIGLMIFGFRWVSERVFAREQEEALLPLPAAQRKMARLYVNAITLVIILSIVALTVLEFGDPSAATRAVVQFPLAVLTSLALFQIGRILRGYRDPDEDTPDADGVTKASTHARIVRSAGLGAIAVSIAAPVLFAFGYQDLSDAILRPYVTTLAVLGLVMALQRFSADVYGAITGQGPAAREALMPLLFGLILLMLAAPALALVWGARVADLTELWAAFGRGFTVGESRIAPSNLLAFAIIFAIGYLLTRLLQGTLRSNVLPKTKIDIGGQNAIAVGAWVCRYFSGRTGGDHRCGDRPELARDCGWCLVGRYRFWPAKHRQQLCLRDHLADRTADLGRRLDRGRRTDGLCARHFGSVDADRNL